MTVSRIVGFRPSTAFIVWVAILLVISLLADLGRLHLVKDVLKSLVHYDVLIHFLLVGVLGFFAALAGKRSISVRGYEVPLLLFGVMLFAVTEEFTQMFRVKREFSWADMAANVFGILFFASFALNIRKRNRQTQLKEQT
mgnify:CR=1 FL=1